VPAVRRVPAVSAVRRMVPAVQSELCWVPPEWTTGRAARTARDRDRDRVRLPADAPAVLRCLQRKVADDSSREAAAGPALQGLLESCRARRPKLHPVAAVVGEPRSNSQESASLRTQDTSNPRAGSRKGISRKVTPPPHPPSVRQTGARESVAPRYGITSFSQNILYTAPPGPNLRD
jgi:hypothetical protein